jgi:hypothetical protein
MFLVFVPNRQKPYKYICCSGSHYTVKKIIVFPSPAGMSLTKFSLSGNNLIIPAQGEFG